jgi:hypothetical protein
MQDDEIFFFFFGFVVDMQMSPTIDAGQLLGSD